MQIPKGVPEQNEEQYKTFLLCSFEEVRNLDHVLIYILELP